MKRNKLVIHISGPSGSGKTTLGEKLKKKFGDKIVVKDLDDLEENFAKKQYGKDFEWYQLNPDEYQNYLDKFINRQTKPLVLVGLNDYVTEEKRTYYDLHTDHKYYIDVDDMVILKQKCLRYLEIGGRDIMNNKMVMKDMINNNERFVKYFIEDVKYNCDLNQIKKLNNKWRKDYRRQDYKFASRETIYRDVVKLLII